MLTPVAVPQVWDRMFGTLYPEPRDGDPGETEPSYYGVIPPLHSFNPLWANIHHWYGRTHYWFVAS